MTGDQFQCVIEFTSESVTSAQASLTVHAVGVTTLAGWPGWSGSSDGTGRSARLYVPGAVRTDPAAISTLRTPTTTSGGSPPRVSSRPLRARRHDREYRWPGGDGPFRRVGGVAIDSSGNVFVADSGNYTIRKVTPSGTVVDLCGCRRG